MSMAIAVTIIAFGVWLLLELLWQWYMDRREKRK